jgi:hypothetical protein
MNDTGGQQAARRVSGSWGRRAGPGPASSETRPGNVWQVDEEGPKRPFSNL